MAASEKDREEIFYEALEIQDPDRRAAYLEEACGADSDLRARVEALLKAHERAGDFLKTPAVAGETVAGSALEGPGSVIGHYELLELTGEGGMGLVYLAEQKEPVRRRVAFKVIKPGMDSKQVIGRFEAERQALAVLDHPNIAHVFDAGTTDTGRPYFVMEYVRGMSITRYCDEHKLDIEQRLRLFEQVCEGVHHAHQKGIIHRDLKPSNILVSVHGDRAIPKIIDFGVAKAITQPLTDKTFITLQGHLLGTPEYMSPEQVDLATQDIDTRSDIYSLGVVLYELLTGVLPFESEAFERAGLAEIQQTIREMEPASPSLRLTDLGEQAKTIAARRGTQVIALARRLHRELEWIPLKAMRKDRCRRYRSASEMADDVRNYLAGLPLLAGPETTIYRVQKFVRKHAGSVGAAILVAVVIVLGLIVSVWQATVATDAKNEALRAKAEKDRQTQIAVQERDNALVAQRQAERQRQRAEASEQQAQNLLYAANMNVAQHAWEQNNVGRLRQLLEETATFPHRGFEWYYWQRQAHLEIRTFRHRARVWSIAFSPDGQRIVTAGTDGTAKIWEATSGKELLTLQGHSYPIASVAMSSDPDSWGVYGGHIWSAGFSADGQRIATGSSDTTARVWDASSGKELLTLKGHSSVLWSVGFSPDDQRIVTASDDGTAKVWQADNGEELLTLEGHAGPVWSAAFSPDSQRIVTGSSGGTAKVWEASSGKELLTLQGPTAGLVSAAFSPDGQRIVTGSDDGTAKVWDASSGEELLTLKGHSDALLSVAFSPDGERIVGGGMGNAARVWDASSGEELPTLKGHSDAVLSVAFSPDGRRVATGSQDSTAKLWDATGAKEQIALRGHSSVIRSVAFSPDSQQVCTGSLDGTAILWDTDDGRQLLRLEGHKDGIKSVAFSPDGQWIITGSDDQTAKVWEAQGGKELLTLQGHSSKILSTAFSPDGQRIVTGGLDATARMWDATSGKELMTLKWHDGPIQAVAFSPD
ncbi:MAG: WD40 repeat domain-containing serine/threonine protein kinase, partial [Planctomycetota bacterium]